MNGKKKGKRRMEDKCENNQEIHVCSLGTFSEPREDEEPDGSGKR